MRHTYECPLRWADMDLLGHINNVAYLDYLQEARIAMVSAHPELSKTGTGEGLVVVGHEMEFVRPLKFRKRPVLIDSWVTEIKAGSFVASYEIYDDGPEGRTVYFRASSRLAAMVLETGSARRITPAERAVLESYLATAEPRNPVTSAGESQHVYPVQVRWSDLDPYHHVNNVKYVEYFQESRIQYAMHMHQPGDVFGEFVVARIDIDYRRPLVFRDAPYEVHSWISHVGTTSAVFCGEIRDGDTVFASSQVVTVGFDPATQKSAPLPGNHRDRLLEQLRASGL